MSEDAVVRLADAKGKAGETGRRRPAALGRGLGALLGESRREEPLTAPAPANAEAPAAPAASPHALALLAVADIAPHPGQPRRHFDEAALDELAQSIATRGVIQPIIVRPVGQGRYQLVAGERRWRAAQRARLHEIPAIIRTLDDGEVTVLALIENLQREDLNPVEEAQAYQRLVEDQGLSQQEVARLVDKSRSHVANMLRMLALPAEVLGMVEQGNLSMGHARALVTMDDPLSLAQEAVERGLSVRAIERAARRAQSDTPVAARRSRAVRDAAEDADIAAVERQVEEFLGLKVSIQAGPDPHAGAVTVHYRTLDQLDLICQRLTGGSI